MSWNRCVAAFLVAPATPAFLFAIPGLLTGGSGVLAVFIAACVVTYAHAVLLGAPAAVLLAKKGRLSLWSVVGAAFLVGALPFGAFTLYHEATMSPGAGYVSNGVVFRENGQLTAAGFRSAVMGVLQCGFLGAATGFVWWLIARPKSGGGANDGQQGAPADASASRPRG